jgi:flagellar protein FlaG
MNIAANIAGNGVPRPFFTNERRKQAQAAAISLFAATMPDGKMTKTQEFKAQAPLVHLERISHAFNKKLQFVVNHDSNQVTVKVIDGNTDKVIKVLPPEELKRLNTKLTEEIGFLFDEKV